MILKAIGSTNQKGFLLSSIYKHLKWIFTYARNKEGTWLKKTCNALVVLLQSKPIYRVNEEICSISNRGRTAKNEWENDGSDFLQALYNVYKKLRTILFPCLLINLFKERYVSSVISIWTG